MQKKTNLFIYSTICSNFSTLLGSWATLSSPSARTLWVRSSFFKDNFFFYFSCFDGGAFRVFRYFSRILYAPSSPFLFRPVMVVKFNQKYLELPKEAFWNLLRSQIHCQCIRRLDAGNDEFFKQWTWNEKEEEVAYKIRENERKTRDSPRSKPEKRRKFPWRNWNGPKDFREKDSRGSLMILKV